MKTKYFFLHFMETKINFKARRMLKIVTSDVQKQKQKFNGADVHN